MYLVREIDELGCSVVFYGKRGNKLEISCKVGECDIRKEALNVANFAAEHAYSTYNIARKHTESTFPDAKIISIGHQTMWESEQMANYRRRKLALLDAREFFRNIEKKTEFKISFPINCSTRDNEKVFPRTDIVVEDERTKIFDYSSTKTEFLCAGRYRVMSCRDFSRMPECEMFDENHQFCHLGLWNFADAWPDIKEKICSIIKIG